MSRKQHPEDLEYENFQTNEIEEDTNPATEEDKDQVRATSKDIEAIEKEFGASHFKPITNEEKAEWLTKNVRLLYRVVHKFDGRRIPGYDFEDLVQEARERALIVIPEYDPTADASLSSFVFKSVLNAIRMIERKYKAGKRVGELTIASIDEPAKTESETADSQSVLDESMSIWGAPLSMEELACIIDGSSHVMAIIREVLPEDEIEITLRYIRLKNAQAIARELGLTPNFVQITARKGHSIIVWALAQAGILSLSDAI